MRLLLLAVAIQASLAAQPTAAKKIAAVRVFGNPGQTGLFIAASDGSGEHPLVSSGANDYDPAWAPDGSSIVFTSERDGSADLYRARPDGSDLERLTNDPAYDDQAAFSPDGKQIVFVTTRNGGHAVLWTMELATHRAKALTSGTGGDFRPSWSPDGKWIAFSSVRGNAFPFSHGRWERLELAEIYVMHPDGSAMKKVTNTGNFCGSPKWMSDNRHVVAYCMTAQQTLPNRIRAGFSPGDDTRLVSIDVVTGSLSDLPAGPGVKFNPSPLGGNEIGYLRKDQAEPGAGIYYTGGRRGPKGEILAASWSPDGKQVVFNRALNVTSPPVRKIFSMNPNYELSLTGTILPSFSPGGDRFVAVGRPGPTHLGATLMVTTAGGDSKVIHEEKSRNVLAPQWSPRGDKIIFSLGVFPAFFDGFHKEFLKTADRVEGGAQVAIVNPDGSGFEELTSGGNNDAFPSFSPDGKRFVYRSFEKDGYGLRIMNLEDKSIAALTRDYDNFPLWSPRGDLIMFSRLVDGAYEIFTIKPDGSALKRLTFTHGNDAHQAWSPDGEYIVFASSRMGFKDEVVYTNAPQPYGELFVMRSDGTHVEQLTDNQWEEGTPAWQPVGSGGSARAAR